MANTHSEPVDGGSVTFTAPGSGAGIATSPVPATIGSGTAGQASLAVTANATGGSYNVAASAAGTTPASVTFSLTNATPIVFSPATLPAATAGIAYSQTVGASSGEGTGYTVSVTSGSLPAWLSLGTSSGTLTLTNVAIIGNSATSGRISSDGGSLTLIGSTLSGNIATDGNGGIANSTGSAAMITNSTHTGNSATGSGGGIANNGGALTLASVTVSNGAAASGSIHNTGGAVTLANTIVAGNIGGAGAVIASSHHNLIGAGGSGGLANGANNNLVGVASPGLDTLKSNGVPTQTLALLFNSPAIAAGDHTACAAAPTGGLDQRGLPRPAATCGSTTGGTPITLTGASFASGATVSFGATAATNVIVVDSRTITASIPGGIHLRHRQSDRLTQPAGPTTGGVPNPRPALQPSGPTIRIPDALPPSR